MRSVIGAEISDIKGSSIRISEAQMIGKKFAKFGEH